MAVSKVEGEELRKQIQMGKKRTMSFAFCPGKKDDHVMMVDRRLKPEILRKAAKNEGSGVKVAYGTFELKGKTLTLSCLLTVPAMAKILKKYLKAQKMTMDIVILDATGEVVDSVVENLDEDDTDNSPAQKEATPEDDSPAPSAEIDQQSPPEAKTEQPDDSPGEGEQLSAKALAERIKALQPALAGAPDALKKVLGTAVEQIKNGTLQAADRTITALEKAADKIGQSAPTSDNPAQQDAKKETQPAQENQPDARALAARASALREVIAGIAGPAAGKLGTALTNVVNQIKASNLEAADALLGKIEAAANKTMEAAGEARKQVQEAAKTDPAAAKWQAAQAKLQPMVEKMIAEKRGDLGAINRFFNFAKEQAEAGSFDKALAAAGRLAGLLKEAAAATTTAEVKNAESDIPDNMVPYVKSRLSWIKTRSDLQQELSTLQSAIHSAVADIDGLEQVTSKTGVLFDYLNDIDTDLESTLEKLVESPDGTARESLKKSAMSIVANYRNVLDSDFFKDVDNNGFVKTNIRATALKSLDEVSEALAA